MRGSFDDYRPGMSVLRLDDVVAEVLKRSADSGRRIIGVDGPQGSGKTTLAARIAACIVRLRRGLERDGESHRELWLDSITTERQFFTDDPGPIARRAGPG